MSVDMIEEIPSAKEQFERRRRLNAMFRTSPRVHAVSLDRSIDASRAKIATKSVQSKKPEDNRTWADIISTCDIQVNRDGSPSIQQIILAVVTFYGVTHKRIISAQRDADIVYPRMVAIYLCRVLSGKSMPQISAALGGRDHTTILHAFRKIDNAIDTNAELADQITMIMAMIDQLVFACMQRNAA